MEHVHVPGREVSDSDDHIPMGEVEIGMGIHNEPGSHRAKAQLGELIQTMLLQLLDDNDPDRAYITRKPEDKFALLINNLGGLSTLELSGITDEVYRQLNNSYKVKPERIIQGTFLTSLNGLGFSISLLKLADNGLGPGKSFLELLDAPAEAVGWSAPIKPSTWEHLNSPPVDIEKAKTIEQPASNVKCTSHLSFPVLYLQKLQWISPKFVRSLAQPSRASSMRSPKSPVMIPLSAMATAVSASSEAPKPCWSSSTTPLPNSAMM